MSKEVIKSNVYGVVWELIDNSLNKIYVDAAKKRF